MSPLDLSVSLPLIACLTLVLAGSVVQVVAGAGLSVVCGAPLLLWLGPAVSVPTLLCLNLLVSVVATAAGHRGIRWGDTALAALATLAGCVLAAKLPALPIVALKLLTATVLIAIASPRPPAPDESPSAFSAAVGVALAGVVTGALTVWTATPGPITPVAFAWAGRSGTDIRRTMQPISVVGYGVAVAWSDAPRMAALGGHALSSLGVAALVGTGIGFCLRPRIDAAFAVSIVRVMAGLAALSLLMSIWL